MRAAGAQRRRTAGNVVGHDLMRRKRFPECMGYGKRGNLAAGGQRIHEIGDCNAERFHVGRKIIARFVDDVHGIDLAGEIVERLLRKRPNDPELERARLGHRVAYILVGGAGADDADFGTAHLNRVVRAILDPFLQGFGACGQHDATRFGECGHHDPLRRVLLVGLHINRNALAGFDDRLRMARANRGAHHERCVETLGELVSIMGETVGFRGVRRLEHGNCRRVRIETRILLVLRREHARVIGSEHEHAAVHARVRNGEQRVCGDVHADVLHRRKHACSGSAGANGYFDRDLFIRCPFCIDVWLLRELFHGLGGRRSRIGDADVGACLPGALGDGFISRHECHVVSSPLFGS